jgi:hypothetical protein
MSKKNFIFHLFTFLLVFTFSCNQNLETEPKSNHEEKQNANPNTLVKISSKDTTPIIIDAVKLSSDYIDNEIRADKLYKGKTVLVTGNIKDIKRGITDNIYVILVGKEKMRSILCDFNNVEKASELSKGMKVSFKGVCQGLMANIIVENCELLPSKN